MHPRSPMRRGVHYFSSRSDDSDVVSDSEPERIEHVRVAVALDSQEVSGETGPIYTPASPSSSIIVLSPLPEDDISSPLLPPLISQQFQDPRPPRRTSSFIQIPTPTSPRAPATTLFQRFAYSSEKAARSSPPSLLASTSTTHAPSPLEVKPARAFSTEMSKPSKAGTGKRLTARSQLSTDVISFPFSDEEWKRLRACVCCDEPWTSRKTFKGKIAHLKSCAKEHFFSEEVIQQRIRKELDGGLAAGTSASESKNQSAPPAGTLLEGVVNDAVTVKKKSRKPPLAVTMTSRNLSDTRKAIRDRAESLLMSKALDPNQQQSSLSVSAEDVSPEFPSTQVLPRSRLGTTGTLGENQPIFLEFDDVFPPATQQAPPSALGNTSYRDVASLNPDNSQETVSPNSSFATPESVQIISESEGSAAPSIVMSSTSSPAYLSSPSKSPRTRRKRQSGSPSVISIQSSVEFGVPSDQSHLRFIPKALETKGFTPAPLHFNESRSPSPRSPDWDEEDWGADAQLEWNGIGGSGSEAVQASASEPESTSSTKRGSRSASLTSDDAGKSKSKSKSKSASKGKGKGKGRAKAKTKSESIPKKVKKSKPESELISLRDEARVHEVMREMITSDKQLHLRILRYEPINFDVFMELAIARKLNPRGLRSKLLDFLDSQNVQFQHSGPAGGQRRRR